MAVINMKNIANEKTIFCPYMMMNVVVIVMLVMKVNTMFQKLV